MNWAKGISWLSALTPRQADGHAGEIDPADMGTAFGLDASFAAAADYPLMLSSDPAAPGSFPWEHRLTRRSGL